MADRLRDFFNKKIVTTIGSEVQRAYPSLNLNAFTREVLINFDALSLTQRSGRIAEALHTHLPEDIPTALDILSQSFGPELQRSDSFGLSPFRYMPYAHFVARWGLEHFDKSMRFQYELTKRFTAEGSIRPFLVRYPHQTYAQLLQWASDSNVHVRRLVSEGSRPRLPWAQRLRAYQQDPSPVVALLELLKDDSERYVQRSVANNLNDIAKDHPDRVVEVCERWSKDASAGRTWIIKHALRSLAKRTHRGALNVLGTGDKPKVKIESVQIKPSRVKLGDKVSVSFSLESAASKPQLLMVDYAVHFMKANGKTSPKVFKLRKLSLAPKERVTLEARVSFADLTTRKHYPGRHRIELFINGESFALGGFLVTI